MFDKLKRLKLGPRSTSAQNKDETQFKAHMSRLRLISYVWQAACTLYGPHTLSAYIQEFKKLSKAMATGESIPLGGPSPPDLYDVQIGLLPSPLGDSPPLGLNFGDMKEDITLPERRAFKIGERVNAAFWSANPRYDLSTEGTFAVVERLEGERWIPAYDDDDFCLYFRWDSGFDGLYGSATIEWEVPQEAKHGIYRLRHYGSYKTTLFSPVGYFTGASGAFKVT